MTPEMTLAAIVIIPIVIMLALRINAALVFLSLCLGNVLVEFVANDATNLLVHNAGNVHQVANASNATVKLALLLTPVVLTAIFMIRTVEDLPRQIMNALPAAGVGLLGALLVVPLLPTGLSHNIINSQLWTQAQSAENAIVAASAIVCLLVLWMQRPKTGGKDKKKHKL